MPTAQADHAQDTIDKWIARGYKIAVFVDHGPVRIHSCDVIVNGTYRGVWDAINRLSHTIFDYHKCDVQVYAGDDMDPDPRLTASEIGAEYLRKFPDGFGVMQPCGDPQGDLIDGKPAAARICGSAWWGRGWAKRSYMGHGPTNSNYWHFYSDEELARIAEHYGVMSWRPDIAQLHRHWSFGHMQRQPYHEKNQTHWDKDQLLFMRRQREGWPQSEPLPVQS